MFLKTHHETLVQLQTGDLPLRLCIAHRELQRGQNRVEISLNAFGKLLSLFVWAKTEEGALRRLEQMQHAYRSYALAGGNSFVFIEPSEPQAIHDLTMPAEPRAPFVGFLSSPSAHLPILSVSELAAMWHLPHGESGLQRVAYTSSKQLAPVAQQLTDGVHIGDSMLQGRSTTAWLPKAALSGNVGLVAKTQSGKSNMLALLAQHIITTEPDAAVIVIDPIARWCNRWAG